MLGVGSVHLSLADPALALRIMEKSHENIQKKIRGDISPAPYSTPFLAEFELFSKEYCGEGDHTAAE
jgi:hypothetical protein